jgi:hypothetical protein
MSRVAACPECKEPVVSTLIFPYKEFLCVCCGWTGGYLDPVATPDKLADAAMKRHDEYREKFKVATKGLVAHSGWRADCEKCATDKCHCNHITDDERVSDATAREALNELVGAKLCTEKYP